MRLLLSSILWLPVGAMAQNPELRAAWIARDGLTSRAKIESTLDQLQAANINVVFVNVWSRGYTIHPSDVLLDACGIAQDPDPDYVGRDPFGEVLFEAHRRGIEVEAWFEYGFCFGWNGWYAGAAGTGPVLAANPTWVARDPNGNSQVPDGGGGFFTWAVHEHPEVRAFLIDLATEVVDRYDVDGVQFDRVRYPSTDFGYDATTAAAYQQAFGVAPPNNPNQSTWRRWRADGLIAFHDDLYRAVKDRRSSVRVTNAPVVMPLSYNDFLQDWPEWVRQGSVDFIYPQVYRTSVASYTATLDQQLNYFNPAEARRVMPGVRAISGTSTAAVLGMVAANRARSLRGHAFWYAEGLYDDLASLTANYFQQSVAVPDRPANWRPMAVVREDDDPTTTFTAGFLPTTAIGMSGGGARIALPLASAADHVRFQVPIAVGGAHVVYTHVASGPGLSMAAPHRFVHAGGVHDEAVDQGAGTAFGWRAIGSYEFAAGTQQIEIGARPGDAVLADAVMVMASRIPSGPFAAFGVGTGGTFGGLQLSMSGQSSLGRTVRMQTSRAPAGAPSAIGIAFSGTAIPLFGGTVFVLPVAVVNGLADADGRYEYGLAIPLSSTVIGTALFAQGLVIDAQSPFGLGLSAGVSTVIVGV